MKDSWIGLLDCNNFFVSCERLFRPDLAGKPVVVLSGNDGCIVARSQEVKDMAIPMGVPYFQVKDILEKAHTTTFSSHFALYRDISRRVFTVMREELETVQQYSVDEAFFSVSPSGQDVARRVKEAVEQRVGIPVSVGIAPTKTLAKYTNALAKKQTGIGVFDEENWSKNSPKVPLSAIWGVGGRMELQYKKHGYATVSDLITADTSRIKALYGVTGLRLKNELSGQSVYTLLDSTEQQKSIMSSRSFKSESTDFSVLADAVAYHIRHATEDLRAMHMRASSLRVSASPSRHGDFVLRGGSKEAVFPKPTDNTVELLTEAQKLLKSLFEPGVPYKKVGIVLNDFTPNEVVQDSLFAPEIVIEKSSHLMSLVDTLNSGKQKDLVTFGSRLKTSLWQSKSDSRSPAYTTRWKDIKTVKS